MMALVGIITALLALETYIQRQRLQSLVVDRESGIRI